MNEAEVKTLRSDVGYGSPVQWLKHKHTIGGKRGYGSVSGDSRLGAGKTRRKASPAERARQQATQPYRVRVVNAQRGTARMVTTERPA